MHVHADDTAAASAAQLGTDAYTVRSSVVFGAGRYAPGTPAGRRLIARELAHVAQQGGHGGPLPDTLPTAVGPAPAKDDAHKPAPAPTLPPRLFAPDTEEGPYAWFARDLKRSPLLDALGDPYRKWILDWAKDVKFHPPDSPSVLPPWEGKQPGFDKVTGQHLYSGPTLQCHFPREKTKGGNRRTTGGDDRPHATSANGRAGLWSGADMSSFAEPLGVIEFRPR